MRMMKLSEAIRRGATMHPQYFGAFSSEDVEGRTIATCAVGAALVAMALPICMGLPIPYPIEWGMLKPAECPMRCPTSLIPVKRRLEIIIHLNDFHLWTRERIADWVETVETAEVTTGQVACEAEPICA